MYVYNETYKYGKLRRQIQPKVNDITAIEMSKTSNHMIITG